MKIELTEREYQMVVTALHARAHELEKQWMNFVPGVNQGSFMGYDQLIRKFEENESR